MLAQNEANAHANNCLASLGNNAWYIQGPQLSPPLTNPGSVPA